MTTRATPNKEVSEERARPVGLPLLPLAPEEDPVLAGPVPVGVLVPEERTELLPEEVEGVAVGRPL